VAAAVAFLTAAPFSAPLLHGSDDLCTQEAVNHEATEHGMRAGTAPDHAPHCAICHWWLSTGRFDGSSFPSPPVANACIGLVAKAPTVDPQLVVISSRPARAPPTA
jgi:hypothetical protein